MIYQAVALAGWALVMALVHRGVTVHSWDEVATRWVEHHWQRIRGWADDDLPEVATWLGVVLVSGGVAAQGWAGAAAITVGATSVAVAVRAVRDERAEQARHMAEAVERTRHDAVVEGVAVEMAKVRSALGGAVSQFAGLLDEAIEEILDTP